MSRRASTHSPDETDAPTPVIARAKSGEAPLNAKRRSGSACAAISPAAIYVSVGATMAMATLAATAVFETRDQRLTAAFVARP